jgi:hypothetical protein
MHLCLHLCLVCVYVSRGPRLCLRICRIVVIVVIIVVVIVVIVFIVVIVVIVVIIVLIVVTVVYVSVRPPSSVGPSLLSPSDTH